ncbi:ComEA family DNA-binding protein [Alkalimarinus sediminis]|uniref:ComEA family DNA-binding protein n=1 Tax=Alkalimarinus sediminis TaxID=1632866 RepID=A0A9E8KN81_9ALTE|nr:ComEA family DNA-binding protein [Alkalimarinus sediminis]UZW73444.1 ComEA family DNA-binding protein [Alkalimarinus sediminis]
MRIKKLLSLLTLVVTFSAAFLPAQSALAATDKESQAISVVTGKININSADAQTLASSIKGIGLKKAQAIVDYRDANGPFINIQDLASVSGIGQKTVAKNADLLTVK